MLDAAALHDGPLGQGRQVLHLPACQLLHEAPRAPRAPHTCSRTSLQGPLVLGGAIMATICAVMLKLSRRLATCRPVCEGGMWCGSCRGGCPGLAAISGDSSSMLARFNNSKTFKIGLRDSFSASIVDASMRQEEFKEA